MIAMGRVDPSASELAWNVLGSALGMVISYGIARLCRAADNADVRKKC